MIGQVLREQHHHGLSQNGRRGEKLQVNILYMWGTNMEFVFSATRRKQLPLFVFPVHIVGHS